jgi:16S rRNA (cytosine1402-N4)-methyltransferase
MTEEIMSFLPRKESLILVDATAGGGGHLAHLAHYAGPGGHVYAFDKDPRAHMPDAALGVAQRFTNIDLFHEPFSSIKSVLAQHNLHFIDGLVCDLGVSSHQLDEPSRGFSFLHDGPLDMRMNNKIGLSAYEWLAQSSEKEIADALFYYGGEKKSRAIAALIKKSWPLENSTHALARLTLRALRQKKWSKTHPATRTFQALRIAVNDEMGELNALLEQGPKVLALDGVMIFLSFHSGEDRLIKHAFKNLQKSQQFSIMTKKPLLPSKEEIAFNPRARSAKLRALKRVSW